MTAGHVAGASFETLPLPYRQIIFDAANIDWLHGQISAVVGSSADAVADVREAGGEFADMSGDAKETVLETQEELVDGLIADGVIDEEVRTGLQDRAQHWATVVEELGYADDGDLADLDEWYDQEATDFRPLAEEVYQEGALAHRQE